MARMAPRFLVAISALFLCAPVFWATPVAAQTPADLEVAKQHYMLGKTYYEQAAYDKALKAFQESYRISKRADLLYNIARCHESLAQLAEAIAHYQRYLKGTGKSDSNIDARVRNLKARLEAQQKAVPPVKPPEKKPPEKKPPEKVPASQPVTPPVKPETPSTSSGGGTSWMTYTGWGLVGVGAAMLATGIAFGVRAKTRASEVEDAYRRGDDWADVKDFAGKGETFQTIFVVGLVTGVLAAGGGAALLLLAPKASERRTASRVAGPTGPCSAHLTPFFTGHSVGLNGGFRF